MDPSDDAKPSPPKKLRSEYSDAKKAAITNNFSKRHQKKGRGRNRDKSISRHEKHGSNCKPSSYDFVGTGESLGTGPNSQSIKSNLMPATVPPPRKPTPEELKAQIKNLNKRVKRYEQKHQRHHNFFVTKLRMKDESVLKLNRLLACKKEQVVDLSNKLKVNHLFYVTLHCTKVDSNPMDISTRLLNKLKEEKRSHRVTLGLLTLIKKRADDATYKIRGL